MTGDQGSRASWRLNNCGPSPQEVFRCARVGGRAELDLLRSLRRSRILSPELRELRSAVDAAAGEESASTRIPARLIASMAGKVLDALGGIMPDAEGADPERAKAALGALVRHVTARGAHRGLLGLAASEAVPAARWWSRARFPAGREAIDDVALTMAAFAVYKPPLLLWSGAPSLDWMRVDATLAVHTLWSAGGFR